MTKINNLVLMIKKMKQHIDINVRGNITKKWKLFLIFVRNVSAQF